MNPDAGRERHDDVVVLFRLAEQVADIRRQVEGRPRSAGPAGTVCASAARLSCATPLHVRSRRITPGPNRAAEEHRIEHWLKGSG